LAALFAAYPGEEAIMNQP